MLIRSLSGLVLLVAMSPAQSLTGNVVDDSGLPLAGVQVSVSWNVGGHFALGEPSLRTATTDSNGNFVVEVAGAQTVHVWVAGVVGATRWVSPTRMLGVAGAARLTARAGSPALRSIAGLGAWNAVGPFRVRVHDCPASGAVRELAVVGDQVELPPTPASRFELLTAAGDPLAVFADQSPWSVAPPRTFPVRVVDAAGAPVAAAEVRMRIGVLLNGAPTVDVWGASVTTTADGCAALTVPCSGDPTAGSGKVLFLASKPGHIESLTGFDDVPFVDRHAIASPPTSELLFTLPAAPPIMVDAAMPGLARPGTVLLTWVDGVHIDNRKLLVRRWQCLTVPEHGAIALPPLPTDAVDVNFAVAPLALPGVVDRVPVAMPAWSRLNATNNEIGWGPATPLRVTVRHADDSPATGCRLIVADARMRDATEWPAVHCGLDARGAAQVLIADADPRRIFAIDAAGWQLHEVAGGNAGGQLDLQLQPWAEFRGTVTDAANAPVAGARFCVQVIGRPHRADWNELWMLTLLDSGGGWLPVDASGGFTVRVAPPLVPKLGVRALAGARRFSPMQPLDSVSLPLRLVIPGE